MGKFVRKNPHPTKGNGLPPVTPQQVDRVRRSVLDVVRNKIPDVRLVLDGSKKWDNQQVRLFGMMLNKVMPDLHHSFNEHTVETKNMDELTIEELQEIAKQAGINGTPTIQLFKNKLLKKKYQSCKKQIVFLLKS